MTALDFIDSLELQEHVKIELSHLIAVAVDDAYDDGYADGYLEGMDDGSD